jgi:hypothetical protein
VKKGKQIFFFELPQDLLFFSVEDINILLNICLQSVLTKRKKGTPFGTKKNLVALLRTKECSWITLSLFLCKLRTKFIRTFTEKKEQAKKHYEKNSIQFEEFQNFNQILLKLKL